MKNLKKSRKLDQVCYEIRGPALKRWSRNMPKTALDYPALAKLAALMKARPSRNALYESEGLTEWA